MQAPIPNLLPGDILLYDIKWSLVDSLIRLRTWSDKAHVEVSRGGLKVVASRNGIGANYYLFRPDGLVKIRRPQIPFNLEEADVWFETKDKGLPYGWGDLGKFYLLNIPTKGVICSQEAARYSKAGGCVYFSSDYPDGAVPPSYFDVVPDSLLKTIWVKEGYE